MRKSLFRPFKRLTSRSETRELPQLSISEFREAWRTYQEGSPHELRFYPYKPRHKGWFTISTRSPDGEVQFSVIPSDKEINDDLAFPSFFVYIEAALRPYDPLSPKQNILGTHKIYMAKSPKGEGFSGGRLWFICKGLDGKAQHGHPAGTLYVQNEVLACRKCHKLTYQSRNLSGKRKKQGRVYSESEIDAMAKKVKRPSYAGSPTKAVVRYEKAMERNGRIYHAEMEAKLKVLEQLDSKLEAFVSATQEKRADALVAKLEKEGDPDGILADVAKGDFARFEERLKTEDSVEDVIARWRETENIDDVIKAVSGDGKNDEIAKIIAELLRTREY